MASIKYYLRNTQSGGGAGGSVYDLSDTQGSNATLSATIASNTFAEVLRFQFTLGSDLPEPGVPWSVSINAISANSEARWRIQRLNSSNTVQESSSYSSAENTTGTKTGSITFNASWASGDRVAISVEYRRTSGGGNRTLTLNVNNANSFIEPNLVAAAVSATASVTAIQASSQIATISAKGDANIQIDGAQATAAAQSISAIVNGVANVIGAQADSFAQSITASGEIYATANVSGVEIQSTAESITAIGQVFAVATVTGAQAETTAAQIEARGTISNVAVVHGAQADSFAQTVLALGSGVAQITGTEVTSAANEINATGSSAAQVQGSQSEFFAQEISAAGSGVASVDGVQSESSAAEVIAVVSASQDATATVTGAEGLSSAATVKAKAPKPSSYKPGGQIMVRPMRAVDGRARLVAAYAYAIPANIRADGITVINNSVSIPQLELISNPGNVNAKGVLDIEDSDLILLLAA